MKESIVLFLSIFVFSNTYFAQVPTQCFEIESILVDACGTPENGNEMVRFKVGPNPLDASLMVVDWPNNAWLGLVQDATTATTTADLNATITSCGYLVEPPSFILPAGSNVLLITSQAVSITANSFANLADTLYVLYQDLPVPTSTGHFSNSASTPRTLIIDFTAPASCGDTVTYLGSSLIGGNGAKANFEWDGTVSYANDGCQAPISTGNIDISSVFNNGTQTTTLCFGDDLDLTAVASGNYTEIIWSSEGEGTFTTNNTLTTTYQSSVNDTLSFDISVGIVMPCDDTITTQVTLNIINPTIKDLTPQVADLCPGQSITLYASGGIGTNGYSWSSSTVTADTLVVNTPGTYTATIFDGCFTENITSVIGNAGSAPTISLTGNMSICDGESTTITASGSTNYLWSDNSTNNTFITSTPGNYFVSSTNTCGTTTEQFVINSLGFPPTGTLSGNVFTCEPNSSTTLTVSGGDSYLWSTGGTGTSETYSTSTSGTVTVTNTCGQDVIPFTVIFDAVTASFTSSDTVQYEPGSFIFTNTSNNATSSIWNFGDGQLSGNYNSTNTFQNDGVYTVTLVASNDNGCTDTAYQAITVLPIPELVIPNVFSPNNDEVNDQFFLSHPLVTNIKGTIYNRWGNLLSFTEDTIFSWDGTTSSGKIVPDGTYFYTFEITMINGEVREKSGSVMLTR